MKKNHIIFLTLFLGLIIIVNTVEAAKKLLPIVKDGFNTYVNGSVTGQGNWISYVNGANFVVQDTLSHRGKKALYNNSLGDSVVTKAGVPFADGRQYVYVRTENRSNWGTYANGNAQVGISKGSWGGRELRNFIAVSFKADGNVAYYDPVTDHYINFASYNDNQWTRLEMEWRSSDTKARYNVNNGVWTGWKPIAGSGSFTSFDTVGFDFVLPSGLGGVYFDTLR